MMCRVTTCDRDAAITNLCRLHYRRLGTGTDLHAPVRRIVRGDQPLTAEAREAISELTEARRVAETRGSREDGDRLDRAIERVKYHAGNDVAATVSGRSLSGVRLSVRRAQGLATRSQRVRKEMRRSPQLR